MPPERLLRRINWLQRVHLRLDALLQQRQKGRSTATLHAIEGLHRLTIATCWGVVEGACRHIEGSLTGMPDKHQQRRRARLQFSQPLRLQRRQRGMAIKQIKHWETAGRRCTRRYQQLHLIAALSICRLHLKRLKPLVTGIIRSVHYVQPGQTEQPQPAALHGTTPSTCQRGKVYCSKRCTRSAACSTVTP